MPTLPVRVAVAIQAMRAAEAATKDIVNLTHIYIDWQGNIEVQVDSMRDMEQIPGNISYVDHGSDRFAQAAEKHVNGVRWFYLLKPEEAEAVSEMAESA